jgi:hypothetical protein
MYGFARCCFYFKTSTIYVLVMLKQASIMFYKIWSSLKSVNEGFEGNFSKQLEGSLLINNLLNIL